MNTDRSSIKAVTFDLWETLLFERNGDSARRTNVRCENLPRALNKFGLEISAERVSSALSETISSLLKFWDTDRDVSHLDQLQLFIKHVAKGSATLKEGWINELSSAYISPLFEVPPYLNPDARKVLRWLKDREKCIGLIL